MIGDGDKRRNDGLPDFVRDNGGKEGGERGDHDRVGMRASECSVYDLF